MNDYLGGRSTLSGLALLAERLQTDSAYMASALAAYARLEGLDSGRLAKRLGLVADSLIRLALCRRPESDAPQFADQVRAIASYAAIDPAVLAHLIRQVDALAGLASLRRPTEEPEIGLDVPPIAFGLLAAARDRTDSTGLPAEKDDDAREEDEQ